MAEHWACPRDPGLIAQFGLQAQLGVAQTAHTSTKLELGPSTAGSSPFLKKKEKVQLD